VRDLQRFGDRLHMRLDTADIAAVEADLRANGERAGVAGINLRPVSPGLEDVFLAVLQAEGEAR
jgi:hypothetical protein